MRYKQFRQHITKVVDQDISDLDQIKSIVRLIKESNLDCSIRISNGPVHEFTRIKSITDESFSFTVIGGTSSLRRTARYEDIESLEVVTDVESMVKFNDKVSRFMLLDPSASEYND